MEMHPYVQYALQFLIHSGVSMVLFLVLLLSRGWKRDNSKIVLTLMLLTLLLLVPVYDLVNLRDETLRLTVAIMGLAAPFALGVLLDAYVSAVYKQGFRMDGRFLVRMLPFMICPMVLAVIFNLPVSDEVKNSSISATALIALAWLIYHIWKNIRLLRGYRKQAKESYAALDAVNLKWLMLWAKGIALVTVFDFVSSGLILIHPWFVNALAINCAYIVGLIWYMGYFGLQQEQVHLIGAKANNPKSATPIVKTPGLSPPTEKPQLLALFEDEKLHTEENLTLAMVADRLGIGERRLSELINGEFGMNFFEFVNQYRVREFQERLKQGSAEKLTILAVAYDSGFNSKASFNRIFKQQTGLTPSQYRKSLANVPTSAPSAIETH